MKEPQGITESLNRGVDIKVMGIFRKLSIHTGKEGMSKKRKGMGGGDTTAGWPREGSSPAALCTGRSWVRSGGQAHKLPDALLHLWWAERYVDLDKRFSSTFCCHEQTTELSWWRQKEDKSKEAPWSVRPKVATALVSQGPTWLLRQAGGPVQVPPCPNKGKAIARMTIIYVNIDLLKV